MTSLTRGANAPIDDTNVTIDVAGASQGSVDLLIFQLVGGKVRSDADMIFFNQPVSPEGAVQVTGASAAVDLSKIPPAVDALAVAVTLDDSIAGSLATIPGLAVAINGTSTSLSAPAAGLTTERSAVLVEVYRRNGTWKVRNVSAGWSGGLSDLVQQHGVSVDEEPHPDPVEDPVVAAPAVTPPAIELRKGVKGAVDLGKKTGKINLAKGQEVSISKSAKIVAACSWPAATDYDIYALVRYRDGHTETVSQFGTTKKKKFQTATMDGAVRHPGDVGRSPGATMAREVIEISLNDSIVAVVPVVYSAQSNGDGSFSRYSVSMSIDNGQGDTVTIDARNASTDDGVYTCVPGIIINDPSEVRIQYLEQYSAEGERRPTLSDDLLVLMDTGEVNAYK